MPQRKSKTLPSCIACFLFAALGATGGPAAASDAGVGPAKEEILDTGLYLAADGETFHYTKSVAGGEDRILYSRPGETLTPERLLAYEAANAAPSVDEELMIKALRAPAGALLDLVVWLEERPGSRIAREVGEANLPEVRKLAAEVQSIHRSVRPTESLSPGEEESLRLALGGGILPLSGELRLEVETRSRRIEERLSAIRREIHREAAAAVAPSQERLARQVAALGGEVHTVLPVENIALVRLPADQLELLAFASGVARIEETVAPVPLLDDHVPSLGVDAGFWAFGYDGGIWDVGVLDSCLQNGHPALAHVQMLTSPRCDGTDWWGGGHGTQVAGIVASNDAAFRGLAFDIDRMLIGNMGHALADAHWMVSGAGDDAEVINASFGWGGNTSDYTNNEKFFDGLVDNRRVMVSTSAGNNGAAGAMTLSEPARAYNTLSVANVWTRNSVDRGDHEIAASSARGPTPSGRRKPDLAAPGDGTTTTRPDGTFGGFGGTSAAAPHVAGGLILLTELRGSDEPTALKAALIQTADAWTDNGTLADASDDGPVSGSHWNRSYGWGYINLWKAWFNGLDVFSDTIRDGINPPGPDFRLYKGRMFAGEKATLVWNRHVGYNGSNHPSAVEKLTDLDLFAYRQSDGVRLASSTSALNNVEQLAVDATEDVVLKVEVFGSIDPDVGTESYALATEEGFVRVDPPRFALTSSNPWFIAGGKTRVFTVTVTNTGGASSFNNRLTLNLPSGFTLVSGANPRTLPDLAPGATATVSWTVRWDTCTSHGGLATLGFTHGSGSYGETLSASGSRTVRCENLHL